MLEISKAYILKIFWEQFLVYDYVIILTKLQNYGLNFNILGVMDIIILNVQWNTIVLGEALEAGLSVP
jgi:hypothetical protein